MSGALSHRVPQGLSACGRYRALWSRAGGGLWLIYDTEARSTREPEPVATYRDGHGATADLALQVFAQQRASAPVEATRA